MERSKAVLRVASSLLGLVVLSGLSNSKLAAQGTIKVTKQVDQVEIVAPSQPFSATLNTFGGTAGPTFSVGPAQGTLSVSSLILTNLDNVPERIQIFQAANPDACGLNAQIGGQGSIHMDLLVPPSQSISLPFPTPLVFSSTNGHSCIGMSGGTVPGIVVVQVTGFVSNN